MPGATEVVFAVGGDGALVGNTTHCDYPEPATRIAKVGGFLAPDLERIMARTPDLVILTIPTHRSLADKLGESGVRIYVSDPRSVDDVLAEIDSIGALLGRSREARRLTDSLRNGLSAIQLPPDSPKVFLEIADLPLVSVGSLSFLDDVVKRAGGRNIFSYLRQDYPIVDAEAVFRADPDVILLLHPASSGSQPSERIGWATLRAVRQRRVFSDREIDPDLLVRPGPRIVQGVVLLSGLLSTDVE